MSTIFAGPNQDTCSTLIEVLRGHSAGHCDRAVYHWLSDGETEVITMTYGQLDRHARAMAGRLQRMGMTGHRAMLCYGPGLDFITSFLGCLYAGVIAVPAFPPHSRKDITRLEAIVRDCSPSLVLTTARHVSAAEKLFAGTEQAHLCLATDNLDCEDPDEWSDAGLKGTDLAYLQYTSGSTATPRGVMISHANVIANLDYIDRSGGFDSRSVSVSWLPHFHDMGLIYGFLQPIYSRFPVYLFSPAAFIQQPLRWLQAISRYRGTHTGGPNFAYDFCCERVTQEQLETLDLRSWQIAFNGSEPVHRETLERFAEKFAACGFRSGTFFPVYGLAEATLMVTTGQAGEKPVLHSVAFRLPGL